MKTRHRIPSIFNLSMVDLMCCALGSVILLWLLNFREARMRARTAGEDHAQLTAARQEIDDLLAKLASSLKDRDALQSKALIVARARDRLEQDLSAARAAMTSQDQDLATLKMQVSSAEDRLTKKTLEQQALAKDLTTLKIQLATAEQQLTKKIEDYRQLVRDRELAQKEMTALQTALKDKDALAKAAAKGADDFAGQLRDTKLEIVTLQKALSEQKTLADKANIARVAAENRFAGIELTGRRVVFLVDTSGSMDLVDDKTVAPDKWKTVCETAVKIARSLPELEKFQVITFSDKLSYLFGNEDQWLDYDPKTSPDKMLQALLATKPKGNTNLYSPLEAAFKLKDRGLDTIYFLSDGLPNVGPGLPASAKNLGESEQAALLSQHIRKMLKTNWNRPAPGRFPVRINTVGFFYESPDVGAFLWALARENDGSFVGMSKP